MAQRSLMPGVAAILVLLFASRCLGAIRPGFELDECTWNASQIIVASQGPAPDHRLMVLESWKGQIKPGDMVTLPDLPVGPLDIYEPFSFVPPQSPFKSVSAKRVLLFLKARNNLPATQPALIKWVGSNRFDQNGGSRISAMWIEDGHAFAYSQIINPGPLRLTDTWGTEAKVKERIKVVLGEKDHLEKVLAIADPAQRAQALGAITRTDIWCAKWEAFARLGDCDKAALPVLRAMLRTDRDQQMVVDAIAAAAGREAGAEMTKLIHEEIPYWREVGPKLGANWWNDDKQPQWNLLRQRYTLLDVAFSNLLKEKYPGALQDVLATRDEWTSFKQLNDDPDSIRNQVISMCNQYIQSIGQSAGPVDASAP